jgi:hypothetical protein
VFTEKKGAWPQIMADSKIKRLHFDTPKLQSHITYIKRKSKTPTSQQPSSQQREQILKNIIRSSRKEGKDEDEDIEFEDVSSIIDYWANKEPESNEKEDKSQPISEEDSESSRELSPASILSQYNKELTEESVHSGEEWNTIKEKVTKQSQQSIREGRIKRNAQQT